MHHNQAVFQRHLLFRSTKLIMVIRKGRQVRPLSPRQSKRIVDYLKKAPAHNLELKESNQNNIGGTGPFLGANQKKNFR